MTTFMSVPFVPLNRNALFSSPGSLAAFCFPCIVAGCEAVLE